MAKRYLFLLLLTMTALMAACESLGVGQQQPTPIPFALFTAQDVIQAFSTAGLEVQAVQRDMAVGRGAPNTFSERYVFEIPRIAPAGGQILVFQTQEDLDAWQNYIAQLRADSSTRREVVYVYVKNNVMLQVNANLTTQEARAFENALENLTID
ncbi:MAG TPA: hypothetical protein VK003_07135 [Oceanobacillus sp.]|nr:hypothetical protein [Oceanobacillus sp.]